MHHLQATPYYVPGDDACFSESDDESTELSAGASSGPACDAPAAAAPPGGSMPSNKGKGGAPPPASSPLQQPFALPDGQQQPVASLAGQGHSGSQEQQPARPAAAAVPVSAAGPAAQASPTEAQHMPKRARRAEL
jgi:hypothetical protein